MVLSMLSVMSDLNSSFCEQKLLCVMNVIMNLDFSTLFQRILKWVQQTQYKRFMRV